MHEPLQMHLLNINENANAEPQDPAPHMQLARAYVPMQSFEGVFPPEEGLKKGTVFPDLFMPYWHRH